MRIFIVISETHFFQPAFLAAFLRQTTDLIVGAALVTKVLPKNDLDHYLRGHWYMLRPLELLKLGAVIMGTALKARLKRPVAHPPFSSVRAVLESFGIDFFEVEYDINRPVYLERMRALTPEVIVSSNPLIFQREILNLPTRCCLNRHSALLPANGGIWPVFQAYRKGEACTGVSIHTMEKKLDKGIVLAQRRVPIRRGESIWSLYAQCYRLSAEALLAALDKVRVGDYTPCSLDEHPASYHSFPTRQHWREFRARAGKFI